VLEISFTASAGASDALYEKFCLEHKNIKFEFQENINKEKTAASKMLTAVLFYWNYFLMRVILK